MEPLEIGTPVIVLLVLHYLAWSVANSKIASAKGRDASAAFALSLACSPMIVWCYLVAVPPERRSEAVAANPRGIYPGPDGTAESNFDDRNMQRFDASAAVRADLEAQEKKPRP